MSDGTIRCWGYNDGGQLGSGARTYRTRPVIVPGIRDAAQVVGGQTHSCARMSGGTVMCWGTAFGHSIVDFAPTTISGFTNVLDLATRGDHTCAIRVDGTGLCVGANNSGQLGDGTMDLRSIPVAVSSLSAAAQIITGSNVSCAALMNGTARCWGANTGTGGDVSTLRLTATEVPGLTGVTRVAASNTFGCAIVSGGVRCWGRSDSGQLGTGSTTAGYQSLPADLVYDSIGGTRLSGVVELALQGEQACARLAAGTVRCWGANALGSTLFPTAVPGLTGVAEIAAGETHTCARMSDGTVMCWGSNNVGQLGDGTTTTPSAPVAVQW